MSTAEEHALQIEPRRYPFRRRRSRARFASANGKTEATERRWVAEVDHRRHGGEPSAKGEPSANGKPRTNGRAIPGARIEIELLPDRAEPAPARRSFQEFAIRAVNILVAVVALVLLAPVMLLIAVAIKLDSRGPVFYRQLRVGLDRRDPRPDRSANGSDPTAASRRREDIGGRPFTIYKFRTMHLDAEEETGPVWASPEDDRTTRVGRFLRRYRLDELPQFLNVLKGDMSVVGPRPERPNFVRHLRDEFEGYTLRQRVPPGITGWAQVNQEPDQTLDDVRSKLRYDLEYLHRRSLAFDVRIMLKTLPVMLEGQRLNGRR